MSDPLRNMFVVHVTATNEVDLEATAVAQLVYDLRRAGTSAVEIRSMVSSALRCYDAHAARASTRASEPCHPTP